MLVANAMAPAPEPQPVPAPTLVLVGSPELLPIPEPVATTTIDSTPIEETATTTEQAVGTVNENEVPFECSCVKVARAAGVPLPYGVDAEWYRTFQHSVPTIGGVTIMRYVKKDGSVVWHLVANLAFKADGIWIREGGEFENGCEDRERLLPYNDPSIYGFWSPAE